MSSIQRQALAQFDLQLKAEKDKILLELFPTFIIKLSLQVLMGVVMRTPVDTGRARGNWQVSIGATIEGTIERSEKGTIGDPSGATVREGELVLSRYSGFQSVFIVNNVEYIEYLNEGSSKQIPANFIELTLTEVAAQFGVA